MQTRLKKLLLTEMPDLGESEATEIVRLVAGQKGAHSAAEFAQYLLSSQLSLHAVLQTLLKCEHLAMQLQARVQEPLAVESLIRVSKFIDGFTALKLALINAVATDPDRLQASSFQPDREVMEKFQLHWQQQGQVQLYNYFREMPVTGNARLLSVEGDYLHLEINHEVERVFVAGSNTHEALTALPGEEHVLRLGMRTFRDGVLEMAARGLDKASRENRHDVRIQLDGDVAVRLSRFGVMINARMHDISVSGIGLDIDGDIDLQPGEMDGCLWELNGNKVYLESLVRWVYKGDDSHRAGLKFAAPGPFSALIQQFLLGEQHKLIERLRSLGKPHWMRK